MPNINVLCRQTAPLAILAGFAIVVLSTNLHAQVYRSGSTSSYRHERERYIDPKKRDVRSVGCSCQGASPQFDKSLI